MLLLDYRNDIIEAGFTVVNDTELDILLPFLFTDFRSQWRVRMVVITATEATVTNQQGLTSGDLQIVEAGQSFAAGSLQLAYLKSGATGFFGGGGANVFC